MNFLIYITAVVCLVNQALGYDIDMTLRNVDSHDLLFTVTSEGHLYVKDDIPGSYYWFRAKCEVFETEEDLGTYEGPICEENSDEKAELIRQIVVTALQLEECSIPVGTLLFKGSFSIDSDAFGDLGSYSIDADLTLFLHDYYADIEPSAEFNLSIDNYT